MLVLVIVVSVTIGIGIKTHGNNRKVKSEGKSILLSDHAQTCECVFLTNTTHTQVMETTPEEEVVYATPSTVNVQAALDHNCEEPGTHYSVPLPTDPCKAYGMFKITLSGNAPNSQ